MNTTSAGLTEFPIVQFRDPAEDLIRKVEPHLRQKDLLEIPDSIYEALYGGAAYGGKSFILTLLPLLRGFYKYRGFKGILLRRELTDLEKEVIRLSKEYFPLTGARYNENKHSWEWKEYGSYFDFSHIQHLKDVKAYDTAQYNYCAFDELTHFEEPMYRYFVGSRVRPSSSFNIAIVRNGSNPGGIGQTFVYNRFVRPCESGYKIIKDKITGLRRIYIPALAQDNPYGMQYDPDYLQKLEILPEAEKRAKKYGDWHAFEGSVFTTFRPLKFPDEPANALHVCPYFEIPEWWPRLLVLDWGKRAVCYAIWGAISPDNRLYLYRERWWKNRDIAFWATEVGQISEYENIAQFILCGSGWQDRGQGTIAAEVAKYSKLKPIPSENTSGSRIATLQIVQDFLRFEQKPKKDYSELYDHSKAEMIYRRYGEEALQKYMGLFREWQEETNLPKLQILGSPSSTLETIAPLLVETIPSVVYDENKTEDIKEFDGDDPIDALRYICKFADRYMNGLLGEELERRQRTQGIIQEYQQSHDANRFYRQMEYLEANQSKESFGVKRHTARRSN